MVATGSGTQSPGAPGGSWIVRPKPSPEAPARLWCFPHAGVGASIFRPWAETLFPDVEVCAVQLPGRERRFREPPIDRLATLVPAIADAIAPYVDGSAALFGYSMGAIVAFEVARVLRDRHRVRPRHLFVAAYAAPHCPRRLPPVHELPDADFVEAVRQRWGGIPDQVLLEPDLLELLLPALRADLAVIETFNYAPAPLLDCPISCFGGRDDATVTEAELAAWGEETRGPFRLRLFPGRHFFIQEALAPLLRAVAEDLARFRPEGDGA